MFSRFRPSQPVPLDAARTALTAATTVAHVVAALRNSARAIAGADGITVVRRIGNEVEYIDEDAIAPLWTGQRFPIRACVSGMAMLQRDVVVIPDVLADPRVPLHAYISTFVRSMAMFPIGRDEPMMAMGAYWREVSKVDPVAVAKLRELAADAADAIARIEAVGAGRQVA
jgi:hypothetical protein